MTTATPVTDPHASTGKGWLAQTFPGKKTYAAAIVAILGSAITYFMGEATLGSAINTGLIGALGAMLRAGVAFEAECIKCVAEEAAAAAVAAQLPGAAAPTA